MKTLQNNELKKSTPYPFDDIVVEISIKHQGKIYASNVNITKDQQTWGRLIELSNFIAVAIRQTVRKNGIIHDPLYDANEQVKSS